MIEVFFFKQKTAYEMRISDWSSDVCSSDLVGAEVGLGVVGAEDDGGHVLAAVTDEVDDLPLALRGAGEVVCLVDGESAQSGAVGEADLACEAGDEEIGRASCRERVCRYV